MSQQQQPPASTGAFIGGIVAGLFAGGTGLTLLVFLLGLLIAAGLDRVTHNASTFVAILICYAIALGIGVLGVILVRKNVGFLSGFVIGVAAGLLGGVSICGGIAGGFSNMH